MSVLRVGVMVICDGPSETEECPTGANWMDAVTTTALRSRMAREDGWLTALPGGKDRCQACAKKSLGISEALVATCPSCGSTTRDGMKAGREAVDRGEGPEWCDDEWHDQDEPAYAPNPVADRG